MPKSSCLKCTFWRSGIEYRVALPFTGYYSAKGINSEILKSVGQYERTDFIFKKSTPLIIEIIFLKFFLILSKKSVRPI